MAAGQQVPIDIEGRLNLRVAHKVLNRLWVGPCIYQQRREGVTALVEGDRVQQARLTSLGVRYLTLTLVRRPPSALCPTINGGGVERLLVVRPNTRSSPLRPVLRRFSRRALLRETLSDIRFAAQGRAGVPRITVEPHLRLPLAALVGGGMESCSAN
jgi:hypothetical protein